MIIIIKSIYNINIVFCYDRKKKCEEVYFFDSHNIISHYDVGMYNISYILYMYIVYIYYLFTNNNSITIFILNVNILFLIS